MIDIAGLTAADRGRYVRYLRTGETGRITSWNEEFVFVRYGTNPTGSATSPEDLEFTVAGKVGIIPAEAFGPYKPSDEELRFWRLIEERVTCMDRGEEIRLACGHTTLNVIPLPDSQEYAPCAECFSAWMKGEE